MNASLGADFPPRVYILFTMSTMKGISFLSYIDFSLIPSLADDQQDINVATF